MSEVTEPVLQDENEQIELRRQKLQALRAQGQAFPNDFRRDSLAKTLHDKFGDCTAENLLQDNHACKVAGRLMTKRLMGQASFITLQDSSGKIQVYLREDMLSPEVYAKFLQSDIGDIVGIEGHLFKTKTGELTVKAQHFVLLTKSLRPLPDKFHGLSDIETRYRQRYIDLMVNEKTRETFLIRSKIIEGIRRYLVERDFLEVETPMMQIIPGGAAARPFVTQHNALDRELFLRVSPELYLKRLVVGGFERVFEINRNFRNEGLSTQHNPEFTMLEFYQAYSDVYELLDLTEDLLRTLAKDILGTYILPFQEDVFDLEKPFIRLSLFDSILQYNPDISAEDLKDINKARAIAIKLGCDIKDSFGLGKIQTEIFEETVEQHLRQPTFIMQYPAEVSPLARKNNDNPFVTDRFEFFMAGKEIANGFSELNDAEDQAERFKEQVKEKAAGDLEAMHYDADFVTALEYGLPPTAGEGIGIDRLVMMFTNSASIRDVIFFPHMRPRQEN